MADRISRTSSSAVSSAPSLASLCSTVQIDRLQQLLDGQNQSILALANMVMHMSTSGKSLEDTGDMVNDILRKHQQTSGDILDLFAESMQQLREKDQWAESLEDQLDEKEFELLMLEQKLLSKTTDLRILEHRFRGITRGHSSHEGSSAQSSFKLGRLSEASTDCPPSPSVTVSTEVDESDVHSASESPSLQEDCHSDAVPTTCDIIEIQVNSDDFLLDDDGAMIAGQDFSNFDCVRLHL